MEEPDTISVREYLEQMFTRMESSLIAEIQTMQKDIEFIKTHQLHRGEFDAIINNLHREIDRVERQSTERTTENKREYNERLLRLKEEYDRGLAAFKAELQENTRRTFTIIGLVLTVLFFVLNFGMNFIR